MSSFKSPNAQSLTCFFLRAVKNPSIVRLYCLIVRNWCLAANTLIPGLQNCSNLATTSSNVGCSSASSVHFSKMSLPLSPTVSSKIAILALSVTTNFLLASINCSNRFF